jgi:hypothetical protein
LRHSYTRHEQHAQQATEQHETQFHGLSSNTIFSGLHPLAAHPPCFIELDNGTIQ